MSKNTPPKKFKVFVYYFLQNDSWDGLTEPNLFVLPTNYNNVNEVKVEHIYKSFPLKFENFYLRFFLDDKQFDVKAWMDYLPNATVPVYKDKVYCKVLRLPKGVELKFKSPPSQKKETAKQNADNLIEFEQRSARKSSHEDEKSHVHAHSQDSQNKSKHIHQTKSSGQKPARTEKTTTKSKHRPQSQERKNPSVNIEHINFENLSDRLHDNQESEFGFSQEKRDKNLIDMPEEEKEIYQQNFSSEKSGRGKFSHGLDDLIFDQPGAGETSGRKSSPTMRAAGNQIDRIAESLSEDNLKEKVDEVLKKWSFGVNEKKNLRYMLSTLHEVWSEDDRWKEVSAEKIVNSDSEVRSLYKRAMGQFHVDKNRNKSFKIQYTAQSLYHLFNQAKTEL